MARIPYADPELPEHKDAAAHIRGSRKSIGHLHRMLLHAPPVAAGWIDMYDAVRFNAALSGKLRELVILRVATLTNAPYEWDAHAPIGLAEGMTQAQLDAVPHWETATVFDATERDALAYADAMTRHVQVPDAIAAAVRQRFSPRELVELTVTIAGYNCVSRVLEALVIRGADPLSPG
ncbi:MAG TPA: carboxymuconolactone decarboxylase family protein [Roseomonas sp.]|jgi:alkylhydroperoxidase family enzyme